jgi:hypothetical protein
VIDADRAAHLCGEHALIEVGEQRLTLGRPLPPAQRDEICEAEHDVVAATVGLSVEDADTEATGKASRACSTSAVQPSKSVSCPSATSRDTVTVTGVESEPRAFARVERADEHGHEWIRRIAGSRWRS